MKSCPSILLPLALLLAATPLRAAPLVPCPDCNAPVSSRALFCPRCGAPGDAIAEASAAPTSPGSPELQESPENPEPPSPPLDNALLARINGAPFYALPVLLPDGPSALLPAAALANLETLELFLPSTLAPVPYGPPALSADSLLVRLPIPPSAATNLALHPLAPPSPDAFTFDPAALPPPGPSPVSSVARPDADPIPLTHAIAWLTLSPRALKAALNPPTQETP